MYVWNENVRAHSIRGWGDVCMQGKTEQDLLYDPSKLTVYRRRYIRRAVRTGLMPDKEGPTNAMCRMLMWRCGASFELRQGYWQTHLFAYDTDKARVVVNEMKTLAAKTKLLHAASAGNTTAQDSGVPTISYVEPVLEHRIRKFSELRACHTFGNFDSIPIGTFIPPTRKLSMIMKIDHSAGARGLVATMLTGMLGSPWHSPEAEKFALLQMESKFQMRITTTYDRANYGVSDRSIQITNI